MHTHFEYDGKLPVYVEYYQREVLLITKERKTFLWKGAVIVADRFYNDFPMLSIWDNKGVFFFIRHKENLKFETYRNENFPPKRRTKASLKDEEIVLSNPLSKEKYPKKKKKKKIKKSGYLG